MQYTSGHVQKSRGGEAEPLLPASVQDLQTSTWWQDYSKKFISALLPSTVWATYCLITVPVASWQLIDGGFAAIGSPTPSNVTLPGTNQTELVYDGIWPVAMRPEEEYQRWLIAALGAGLATICLYIKIQPFTQENSATFKRLYTGFVTLFGCGSPLTATVLAIAASTPGAALTYVGTDTNAELPKGFESKWAFAAAICCFIVTAVTYRKSLTTMARDLVEIIKLLWQNPGADKGLLIFAIIMALTSLCAVPGLMASLALLLSKWGTPTALADGVAGAFTTPFYILLLQSCLEWYQNAEKTLRARSLTVNNSAAAFLALVPGAIIASVFAFFVSNGLGSSKLDWADEGTLENILVAGLAGVPTGIAFTDATYHSFTKPFVDFLSSIGSWIWQHLPSNPFKGWCG